jgi:hypothetical protein
LAGKSKVGTAKELQMSVVTWNSAPAAHDYPAATSYLALLLKPEQVAQVVTTLGTAPIVTQKAKDILRAARLPLLPPDDVHVAADLDKVKKNIALSPILLLRGQFQGGVDLQIADGYHRVCASYHVNENTDIPCRIADLD